MPMAPRNCHRDLANHLSTFEGVAVAMVGTIRTSVVVERDCLPWLNRQRA